MKVYDGSLYLETKSSDAKEIVYNNSPMAVRIDVTSEMVTAEAMKKALSEGLKKSTKTTKKLANSKYQTKSTKSFFFPSFLYFSLIFLGPCDPLILFNKSAASCGPILMISGGNDSRRLRGPYCPPQNRRC